MRINTLRLSLLLILSLLSQIGRAQGTELHTNYVGLMPSILVEPYDTVNAVEVNIVPFLYERRIGEDHSIGLQFRPIVNYRFLESAPGISQIGASVVANKYFLNIFEEDFWLKPQLGLVYTYAYNRLDKVNSMTLGLEPGAFMKISEDFSLSANLQPGINYYPDQFSRDFVETESGFKGHFGIIFHIGYNF